MRARVFAADVETCPRCEGRIRLVEVATEKGDVDRILAAHGMGPAPPVEHGPSAAGQMSCLLLTHPRPATASPTVGRFGTRAPTASRWLCDALV